MKKFLFILSAAALLLVGCAKEQLSNGVDGGMVSAIFTASLDNSVATRAAVDGDGAAANVNRCIMEIYYGDELFARQYAKVENKVATFTAQVVSNRKYTVAFWADKVDATTEAGLQVDKYYTTTSLKEIAINGNYIGNDDARDAFYHVGEYTVAQAGSSFGGGDEKILLKRPFAQMNVITTDWDKAASVTGLAPEKVKVTLKNPMVKFNAVTKEASADAGTASLIYTADVYVAPASTGTAPANEKTLSMDYIFASEDKTVIDIDWKALHGSDVNVKHSFAAVPYQRNYRTNIKGALLTTQGQWTVTVDPIWGDPDYTHPVVIATTLAEAQAAVGPTATGAEAAGIVIVKPEAIANRTADDVKGKSYVEAKTTGINLPEGAKAIEFVLTQQSKKDVTFELPALPDANFYWYIRHEEGYPTENLNVKVDDDDATRVIIDAPNNTHVVLNDVEYSHVIAITGDNTLVVPQGIKVDKLTVKKGGVEIHGTVTELEVAPGENQNVYFRSCEGLSATVFAKIYSETEPVCNYIDPWYTYEKVGEVYNIVKRPVVAMIGEVEYKSLSDAVAAVQANQTIEIISDIALDSPITISKSNFTIDGKNNTIAVSDAEYWNQYKIGGDKSGLGQVNMISVKGNNFTLKNVTLDGKACRGVSLCTTSGGKDVLYQNVTYTGRGSGHYYGEAAGLVTFDGCKFDIHGYAVHFGGESSLDDDVVIKNCELNGWSSFGACKSLTISDSHFGGANDEGKNGWLAVLRPYCPTTITNCTFSDIYLHEAVSGFDCIGLGTGAATTVTLNGCKVVNDSKQETGDAIYSIVRENGFDNQAALDGSVFAFDATGNAIDGYTAGTFFAKQAANIKAASKHTVTPVEGKEYIFTIIGAMTPGIYSISTASQLESFADRYNDNSEAGDYILKLNPGTYETANIILVQQPGKTLTIQSSDANNKAILKTNSTEDKQAMFAICSESDYSGGAISFLNLEFDNSTLDSGKESYVFYAAGGGSGLVDGLIAGLRPGDQDAHRYVHDITIDGCNAVSNGVKAQFYYACSGNSGTTIKNCTLDNFGYFANGPFSHGGGREFGLKAINCKVTNFKVFINNQSADDTKTYITYVEGCDISTYHDYSIRIQGGHLTVKDTDFNASYTAEQLPKEAGIIVVGDATKYKSSIIDVDNLCTFTKSDSNLPDLYVGKECTVNGGPITGKYNFDF